MRWTHLLSHPLARTARLAPAGSPIVSRSTHRPRRCGLLHEPRTAARLAPVGSPMAPRSAALPRRRGLQRELPRAVWVAFVGLLAILPTACQTPDPMLRQSLLRSRQIHEQNKQLAQQLAEASQSASATAAEKERWERTAASLRSNLDIANQRLDNLKNERTRLHERYVGLLNRAKDQPSPLSRETTRRFEELARKYPEFEFDPNTGVSKFHSDILFGSGSAQVKTSAEEILRDFAGIMNREDAQRLNILVVGHTDDRRIAKRSTAAKHPTNWHLSTDRADAVVLELAKFGIAESRMGAAGYSKYQPVAPNKDEQSRKRNRRVEIYVLAPDAVVAGWDPSVQHR